MQKSAEARPAPRVQARPTSTFVESLIGMFDAGQAVVLDRIDLLRIQMASDLSRFATTLGFVFSGVCVLLVGWFITVAAITGLLTRLTDWEYVLLGVGGFHLLIGIVFTVLGFRYASVQQTRGKTIRELTHVA